MHTVSLVNVYYQCSIAHLKESQTVLCSLKLIFIWKALPLEDWSYLSLNMKIDFSLTEEKKVLVSLHAAADARHNGLLNRIVNLDNV